MTRQRVVRLAAAYGATVEVYLTDDGYEAAVVAPDDRCWASGPGVLLAHFGGTWGPASDAWNDLAERIAFGLEPA